MACNHKLGRSYKHLILEAKLDTYNDQVPFQQVFFLADDVSVIAFETRVTNV